jgi:hypothetical protein
MESDDGNAALRGKARKLYEVGPTGSPKSPRKESSAGKSSMVWTWRNWPNISRLERDEEPLRELQEYLDEYLEQNIRAKRSARHIEKNPIGAENKPAQQSNRKSE